MLEQKKNKKILSTDELVERIQNANSLNNNINESKNNQMRKLDKPNKFGVVGQEETYWEKIRFDNKNTFRYSK